MPSDQLAPSAHRRKNPGCLIVMALVGAAFVALIALLAVPVSQRLTAPVLCSEFETSVVTTSTSTVTTSSGSSNQTTSRFYCVDDQGRAFPQSTLATYVMLLVEAFLVLFVLFMVQYLRAQARRRRAGP